MTNKKWNEKLGEIKDEFPHTAKIDWGKIFAEEPDIFRSLVGGLTKSTSKNISSPIQKLHKISGEDYAEVDFTTAFNFLWGENTIATMVKKTGLSTAIVYALKQGNRQPSIHEMEVIAKAFGRNPSYFLEYRMCKIFASIEAYIRESPEPSVVWYTKILNAEGIKI